MQLQQPSTRTSVIYFSISLMAWGLLAGAVSAESAAWDQGRVSELAEKLKQASRGLYDAEFKSPAAMGGGGGLQRQNFKDTIRRLEHETAHLAGVLKKGGNRDATLGAYKQTAELNRDAQEIGRKLPLLDPVSKRFEEMESLISQLAPFYGGAEK